MKVAVISDIHGNHVALEAVLAVADTKKVGKLLVLGDIVGYYYHPDKALQLLGDWDHTLVKGNHEDILAGLLSGYVAEEDIRKRYGSGHKMAMRKLSPEQIAFLINAPSQYEIEISGTSFLMCHGSPSNSDQYIYPNSSPGTLGACDRNVDFVLIGHTHYPFVYRNASSTLINVGSVGQSRVKGGVANWVMIDAVSKVVECMSTAYDTSTLESEIDETDPDIPYLKDVLKRGYR